MPRNTSPFVGSGLTDAERFISTLTDTFSTPSYSGIPTVYDWPLSPFDSIMPGRRINGILGIDVPDSTSIIPNQGGGSTTTPTVNNSTQTIPNGGVPNYGIIPNTGGSTSPNIYSYNTYNIGASGSGSAGSGDQGNFQSLLAYLMSMEGGQQQSNQMGNAGDWFNTSFSLG